jgi:hypothetical protein
MAKQWLDVTLDTIQTTPWNHSLTLLASNWHLSHTASLYIKHFRVANVALSRPHVIIWFHDSSPTSHFTYANLPRVVSPTRHFTDYMAFHLLYLMGTGDLPEDKCGRGVLLTTHHLLVPWLRNERGYTSSPPMRQTFTFTSITYSHLHQLAYFNFTYGTFHPLHLPTTFPPCPVATCFGSRQPDGKRGQGCGFDDVRDCFPDNPANNTRTPVRRRNTHYL